MAKLPDTLTPRQLGLLILSLGGPQDEQKIATAIGVCTGESSRRASNSGVNSDAGHTKDRGAWMFNDYWHADVPDSCAYDWVCSTREMLKNSSNCSDWGQWYAYHAGIGDPYIGAAKLAIADFKKGKRLGGSTGAASPVPGHGASSERSTSAGEGLVSEEQRSGLLKALLWVVLVLGGAALAALGLTRALGGGGVTA